jgi:flagellar biosynthesis GTPase FlhF
MSEEDVKKEDESLNEEKDKEDSEEEKLEEKGEEKSEEDSTEEKEETQEEKNSEDKERETQEEEKDSEDKSENSDDKDDDSQESGAKWLVIGLVVVVVAMIVVGWVVSEARKVDYVGLTFTKENFGQIPIYTTMLSGQTINGNPLNFKLPLRGNPKESKIPFEGDLRLDADRDIYLSVDIESGVHECGSDALINFGYFMGALEYDLQTTVTSKEAAEEYNKSHVVCENTNGASVFILTTGEESRIVQQGSDDCYKLEVNDCELTEVMERLEIATLAYIRGEEL